MVAEIGITPGSPSWLRLARLAKVLAALTLVWLGIEGAIGVVAGVLAGSIALVAFGLDSAIEGFASVIVRPPAGPRRPEPRPPGASGYSP